MAEDQIVTPDWIAAIRTQYGLDTRTPQEAGEAWGTHSLVAGAITALGHALDRVEALEKERAIPERWPMSRPILGTIPSPWARDALAFVALLSRHASMWTSDFALKYLTLRIDTRSGHFMLKGRDGEDVTPERVLKAIRAHIDTCGGNPGSHWERRHPTTETDHG